MASPNRTRANQVASDAPVADVETARNLPAVARPRLPWNPAMAEEFGDIGVTRVSWRTLVEAIWPEAKTVEAVGMALSYCKARNLDPFKRPVHIVPVWHSGLGRMVETVWPGISELRTTAMRTGDYAGKDQVVFGPLVTKKIGKVDMSFHEWAQLTVYRIVHGQRCAFEGDPVYWEEAYAQKGGKDKDQSPNAMWFRRWRGQHIKVAEAAALRQAFPEELGSTYAAEEMEGQIVGQMGHNGGPSMDDAERPARRTFSLSEGDYVDAEPLYGEPAASVTDETDSHADAPIEPDRDGAAAATPGPGRGGDSRRPSPSAQPASGPRAKSQDAGAAAPLPPGGAAASADEDAPGEDDETDEAVIADREFVEQYEDKLTGEMPVDRHLILAEGIDELRAIADSESPLNARARVLVEIYKTDRARAAKGRAKP